MPSKYKLSVLKEADYTPSLYAVSFTNGVLNEESHPSVECKVYKSKDNENVKKLVVSTDEMDYAGNFDHSKRDAGKYIGIEDEETGEMTLVPLKRIRLRPAVSITQEAVEEEIEQPIKSKQEQSDSLIESFGGAKQKQNMHRRQKHGIDREMIHDALDAAGVETIPVPDTPTAVETTDDSVIPPHNTETADVNKAYPLNGYFPEEVETSLEAFVDDFVNADSKTISEWRANPQYPSLVLDLLDKLPLSEAPRKSAAVRIKFLFFLIRLYKFRAPDLKAKDPFQNGDKEGLYKIPAVCSKYLLDTYTTKMGNKRAISSRLKDKVLIVIIILALRLENHRIAGKSLMTDLKLGSRKLVLISKAIGCKITSEKSSTNEGSRDINIELKVPLTFPEQKPAKSRKM